MLSQFVHFKELYVINDSMVLICFIHNGMLFKNKGTRIENKSPKRATIANQRNS